MTSQSTERVPATSRSFSDRDFRDALELFAAGVVVVTGAGTDGSGDLLPPGS